MNRYFKIDCDEEGKADEATLVEIYAPSPLLTPLSVFSVGVLAGVVITIVFR